MVFLILAIFAGYSQYVLFHRMNALSEGIVNLTPSPICTTSNDHTICLSSRGYVYEKICHPDHLGRMCHRVYIATCRPAGCVNQSHVLKAGNVR